MDFSLNTAMVAFLDILGFKDKLLNVSRKSALKKLYEEIKLIHRFFEKDPESEIIREAHTVSGRSISSLSDAVVIAIDFNSPLSECMQLLDIISGELVDIALSQGRCVANGIFLRGGIDVGYHFLASEENIILSDAMAKAYQLEEHACYPIISFDPDFYKQLQNDEGNDCYHPDFAPNNSLFQTTIHPKTGEKIYFLDYMRICIANLDEWFCLEDLERYKAEKDLEKKQSIQNASYQKNILSFVSLHKEAILTELKKKYRKSVQDKYYWLTEYHNECVNCFGFGEEYKISFQKRFPEEIKCEFFR